MAVVAVVIVIMALGVLFVCGKRKPLLQIAECISCTKQKGLIGYYDEVRIYVFDCTVIILR